MRSAEEVKLAERRGCCGGSAYSRWGKAVKVVVCARRLSGRTAILEQLLYGNHTGLKPVRPKRTCTWPRWRRDRGVKEQLRLYDTRGLHEELDLPKHYYLVAERLRAAWTAWKSFRKVDILKKEIDKWRSSCLGNKTDLREQRQVDPEAAQQWARGEKVKLWEVSVAERGSLIEPFTTLTSRLTQPQSKSTFPLPGRKSKGTPANDL
ncbi:LOW QUALITY PROTEIN: hypothetical protein CRUP_019582 [Coryphaenoides rupestris]|nr:LOW QUALITY PROTEIN: hypothetical protein CRUP_019582 [Coryphaenoides rupestris]